MDQVTRVLGVSGLTSVAHLHHCAAIVTISCVGHMLNTAIRKSNLILSNDVAVLISRSLLAEVSVIFVIMNSILEVEGVRLLIIASVMTTLMDTVMDLSAVHSVVNY